MAVVGISVFREVTGMCVEGRVSRKMYNTNITTQSTRKANKYDMTTSSLYNKRERERERESLQRVIRDTFKIQKKYRIQMQ
jgi:hypothetical protein